MTSPPRKRTKRVLEEYEEVSDILNSENEDSVESFERKTEHTSCTTSLNRESFNEVDQSLFGVQEGTVLGTENSITVAESHTSHESSLEEDIILQVKWDPVAEIVAEELSLPDTIQSPSSSHWEKSSASNLSKNRDISNNLTGFREYSDISSESDVTIEDGDDDETGVLSQKSLYGIERANSSESNINSDVSDLLLRVRGQESVSGDEHLNPLQSVVNSEINQSSLESFCGIEQTKNAQHVDLNCDLSGVVSNQENELPGVVIPLAVCEINESDVNKQASSACEMQILEVLDQSQDSDYDESISTISKEDESCSEETIDEDEDLLVMSDSECSTESSVSDLENQSTDSLESTSPRNYSQSHTAVLHSSTSITREEGILKVLDVYINNKCSKKCLEDILSTVCDLLPGDHLMPRKKYELFKYVQEETLQRKEIKHYYCSVCQIYIGNVPQSICPVCECERECGVFWELDVCDAVRHFFEQRNLPNIMEEEPVSKHQNDSSIKDICDGIAYKSLNRNRGKYDLNLIVNCDGVKIRKSSMFDLWILMVMPVEVPPHLRASFITIVGVWYDNQQPNMNTFLKPLCAKLRSTFESGGVPWKHPTSEKLCHSQVLAPLVIADAPARAKIQNITNFNGKYGCNLCEVKTVRAAPIPGKRTIRVYARNFDAPLRECQRMIRQGRSAVERGDRVKGVKGPSVMSLLMYVDLSLFLIPEYMHSVLLGVVRQLMFLWFHKPGPWSCRHFVDDVNNFLKSIKPPDFIHRKPRDLCKLKNWKASEFHNWLLFYSLPALKRYMPDRYFQHFTLFVRSIYTLLQSTITESEIIETNLLLRLFVTDMEELYGDREMTYNIHQILHLSLSVKRWGPLSLTSAFCFENVNGIISKTTHGTKNIAKEIVNNVKFAESVNVLKNRVQNNNLSLNFNKPKVLGREINVALNEKETELLSTEILNIKGGFYAKALIGREIYTSKLYKTLKSANFYVSWLDVEMSRKYGAIRFFVDHGDDILIFVDKYAINHVDVIFHFDTRKHVKHILPITETDDSVVLRISKVISLRKEIRVGNYICERPNHYNQVM